jgi:hypothetical protein
LYWNGSIPKMYNPKKPNPTPNKVSTIGVGLLMPRSASCMDRVADHVGAALLAFGASLGAATILFS